MSVWKRREPCSFKVMAAHNKWNQESGQRTLGPVHPWINWVLLVIFPRNVIFQWTIFFFKHTWLQTPSSVFTHMDNLTKTRKLNHVIFWSHHHKFVNLWYSVPAFWGTSKSHSWVSSFPLLYPKRGFHSWRYI